MDLVHLSELFFPFCDRHTQNRRIEDLGQARTCQFGSLEYMDERHRRAMANT